MSGYIFGAFYDITRRIPAGKVATYGQIARLAGMPRCARIVGYAMAACQDPSVPCHRVVDRFGGTKRCFDVYAPGIRRYPPCASPSGQTGRRWTARCRTGKTEFAVILR